MMSEFPSDADGDALRRIAEHSDITKPMAIDFPVVVPTEAGAKAVARLATARGYACSVEAEDDGQWTCFCTKSMLATYNGVIAAQKELDEISAPFEGATDGWGALSA